MERSLTAKVVDTTVISASLKEIPSIDLLGLAAEVYDVHTSGGVKRELEEGFDPTSVEHILGFVEVVDIGHEAFEPLMDWLERRYPYLHRGELSTFLLAILDFGLGGRPCYYVTDDGAMRKKVRKILIEDRFIEILGEEPPQVGMTGTVGLIGRLYEHGVMTPGELMGVIEDLQNGTFRISSQVLDHLRRLLNEG